MYVKESNAGRALYHAPFSQYIILNPDIPRHSAGSYWQGAGEKSPRGPGGALSSTILFSTGGLIREGDWIGACHAAAQLPRLRFQSGNSSDVALKSTANGPLGSGRSIVN